MSQVWPRGIPAAGSFWNYVDTLQTDDPLFKSLIKHTHLVRILSVAIDGYIIVRASNSLAVYIIVICTLKPEGCMQKG